MKRELDEILTHALAPMEEPDTRLNLKILRRAEEGRESGESQSGESTQRRQRSALPALAAARWSVPGGQKEEGMNKEKMSKENLIKEELNKEKLNKEMLIKEKLMKEKRRIPAAALMTVLLLGAGSLTAFAAWNYLTPERIAQDFRAATRFSSEKPKASEGMT